MNKKEAAWRIILEIVYQYLLVTPKEVSNTWKNLLAHGPHFYIQGFEPII